MDATAACQFALSSVVVLTLFSGLVCVYLCNGEQPLLVLVSFSPSVTSERKMQNCSKNQCAKVRLDSLYSHTNTERMSRTGEINLFV